MHDMNWQTWAQEIDATLMFVVKEGQVLLIEKLTGIGKGKVNGPGGKLEPNETPLEAVIRECQEELHITVKNPEKVGELWFVMSDSPDIHCHVYTAEDFEGEPTATLEAIPFWSKIEEIPYHRMWADDVYWLPQLLAGQKFNGRFIFLEESIQWDQVLFGDRGVAEWKGWEMKGY
jgi:8-oxo-dGTP diphosphatase